MCERTHVCTLPQMQRRIHAYILGGQRSTLNVIPQLPSRVSHLAWNSPILLVFGCQGAPAFLRLSSSRAKGKGHLTCLLFYVNSGNQTQVLCFSAIALPAEPPLRPGLTIPCAVSPRIEKRSQADRWPILRRWVSAASAPGHASKMQRPY